MNKATKEEVFSAILSEREYQDHVVGNKYSMEAHAVSSEILMIEEYATKARKAWTDNKGDDAALAEIRKVAALAVRCMEHHGAPMRQDVRLTEL